MKPPFRLGIGSFHGMAEPPEDIHFYVDGSSVFNQETGARQAGAATALVLTSPFRTWWGGLQARKVEGVATSPHAEAAALLQAILWHTPY